MQQILLISIFFQDFLPVFSKRNLRALICGNPRNLWQAK
jgi:hypothetical protein